MPQPPGRAPLTLRGRMFAQTLLKGGQSQSEGWKQSRRWFVFLAINWSMPFKLCLHSEPPGGLWVCVTSFWQIRSKTSLSPRFFSRLGKVNKHTQTHIYKSPDKHAGGCTPSVVAALILQGFPQFVCVWARGRKGACKGTVSLWKTSMKQHCVWFTVRIGFAHMHGLDFMGSSMRAAAECSAVIYIVTLYSDSHTHAQKNDRHSALYHIVGAVPTFPAGIASHHTHSRSLVHVRHRFRS